MIIVALGNILSGGGCTLGLAQIVYGTLKFSEAINCVEQVY